MKKPRYKKYGNYVYKLQTGAEFNRFNPPLSNTSTPNAPAQSSSIDWGQLAMTLTPLLQQMGQQIQQNQLQKNTFQSNDPYYHTVYHSPYAQNVSQQQQLHQRQGQLAGTAASTALNIALPGVGLAVPVLDTALTSVADPKQKYGITYYDKPWQAMAAHSAPSYRFADMFRKDKDEKWGEYALNILTGGGYNIAFKANKRNQANKDRIAELENAENQLKQIDQYKQGIYAKKGIKFGRYTLHQIQNMPKHEDNVVYDSVENKIYPALEKGAGGVVINFSGNEKVLVENGEYVVKDNNGNIIAVLPEKLGKKVLNKEITIEQAFKKIPNINEAETAKVAQDGAVDNEQTEKQPPPIYEPNFIPTQPENLTIKNLIYDHNPILTALLSQTNKQKLIAKKGLVNEDGYLITSKNKNNPVNIIKSNLITTEGMAFPIYANGQLLMPNTGIYKFKQSYVIETPAKNTEKAKCGLKHYGKYVTKAQRGIKRKRTQRPWFSPYPGLYLPTADTDVIDPEQHLVNEQHPSSFNFSFNPYPGVHLPTPDTDVIDPEQHLVNDTTNITRKTTKDIDWYDPDIAKDNEAMRHNSFISEDSYYKKTPLDPVKNAKTNKNNYAGHADYTFRPIDPNTKAAYALGLLQLYRAFTAKPSQRPLYSYDPEVARVLAQSKYYEQFGDTQGYRQALKDIEAKRMQAMQQATQTNTSAGSYLNTIASLNQAMAQDQQKAYKEFITDQQRIGRDKTKDVVRTMHQSERQKVFEDTLADYKEKQDFANQREKQITQSLKYLTDLLQYRREEGIKQYDMYHNFLAKNNENLIEYYLLYGTPEEKEYAKNLLRNPAYLYPRFKTKPLAMQYGTYYPVYQPEPTTHP
ncbi:MAG: hypothetical protein RML94_00145 [Bacteroidia bacterium]|nr:hypothetical protein [Bacteroidia bacterium]